MEDHSGEPDSCGVESTVREVLRGLSTIEEPLAGVHLMSQHIALLFRVFRIAELNSTYLAKVLTPPSMEPHNAYGVHLLIIPLVLKQSDLD
jgi:hypothetical protein